MQLDSLTTEQLRGIEAELEAQYSQFQSQSLSLDLTRGKPSAEQLTLSNGLDGLLKGDYTTESGVDARNYGGLDGISEIRALAADVLGVPASEVLAGGNSSLTLMYQCVQHALLFGFRGKESAWQHQGQVKFLCPVPGYDRHFSICETLGIEMITVPMTADGPDMDEVERLVKADAAIKGIWCVPKFSNPTGVIYSDETVKRIATLSKMAGDDFKVFWDNAYVVHDLTEQPLPLANIMTLAVEAGTQDSILQFCSTSKITFAGAGVAFLNTSEANLKAFKQVLGISTIGADKVNQLRHARFFPSKEHLLSHMQSHAKILRPRFDCVLSHLERAFGDNPLGRWEAAQGGYFVSFDTLPGLAKRVVELASGLGVKLTPAGATFPYGNDPKDSNIRIAPSVPALEEVDVAMQVFVCCVKLASVRQRLTQA